MTESRREQTLTDGERAIIDAIPLPAVILNHQGVTLYENQAARTEQRAGKAIGHCICQLALSDGLDSCPQRNTCPIAVAIDHPDRPPSGPQTVPIEAPDGRIAHLRFAVSRLPAEDRYIVCFEDLTEVTNVNQQLAEQSTLLKAIVDAVNDGILLVDQKGIIRLSNRAVSRILARPPDLLLGSHIRELMPERFRAAHEEAWQAFWATGSSEIVGRRLELSALLPDGQEIPITLGVSIFEHQGKQMLVGILQDVSEERKLRSRMLEMDRMIAVGTLVAGIGHEINNPLAYVLANLEFTSSELTSILHTTHQAQASLGRFDVDSLHSMLSEIEHRSMEMELSLADVREGAVRIRDVVKDLRTFARKPGAVKEPVALREVVESAINMAYNEIRHRARLVKDYGDLPTVQGNRSRLGQIFLNLLVNAAHAIPEGNVDRNTIRVKSLRSDSEIATSIQDTGCGIDKEIISRIFDPFFTTKPQGQGTGLGLAICRQTVMDHGGKLTVESEPGKGSTFTVVLPVSDSEAIETSSSPTTKPPRIESLRILVVDDEAAIGRMIGRLLGSHNTVETFLSGEEALERFEEAEGIDIVLCDLMMPGMTGPQLYREVAKRHPGLERRFIFLTGGAFTPEATSFLDEVDPPKLAKPCTADEIENAIMKLVGRNEAGSTLSR